MILSFQPLLCNTVIYWLEAWFYHLSWHCSVILFYWKCIIIGRLIVQKHIHIFKYFHLIFTILVLIVLWSDIVIIMIICYRPSLLLTLYSIHVTLAISCSYSVYLMFVSADPIYCYSSISAINSVVAAELWEWLLLLIGLNFWLWCSTNLWNIKTHGSELWGQSSMHVHFLAYTATTVSYLHRWQL